MCLGQDDVRKKVINQLTPGGNERILFVDDEENIGYCEQGVNMAKILIIDDEAPIRKMLTILFERHQYIVKDACDGKQGLLVAKNFSPDLIITDLLMPEKEGLETIQEVKKLYPDIKIIAISGGGVVQPEMYLKLAQRVGADKSFTKPIDSKTLLSAVKLLIED